jgi:hypothetical protein
MLRLRPHHTLCIQKFTGHGYSESFTAHMTEIVNTLKSHPDTPVTLILSCDELCSVCPSNEGGFCASLEKVEKMDSLVLELCGFEEGRAYPWQELKTSAENTILNTELFNDVCGSCQWFRLCSSTKI